MWITFLNVRDIASRGSRTWENLEPETFSDAILIKILQIIMQTF